jgi:hypothetical protein
MRPWFNKVRREFSRYVKPFIGQPITYVEIGCWIGGSAEHVARTVLTHDDARGFGIDPYDPMGKRHPASEMAKVQATAHAALAPYSAAGKWTWIQDRSQNALRTWEHGPIDLLYIDGSHFAHDALLDFCYAWPHLKVGSVVIFDDYGIGIRNRLKTQIPDVPDACEAVLAAFGLFLKPIGCRLQFAVECIMRPTYNKPHSRRGYAVPVIPNRRLQYQPPPLTAAERRAGILARRARWAAERAKGS